MVDLDKIEAYCEFVRNEDGDVTNDCAKCGETYEMDGSMEHTWTCNECAHEIVATDLPACVREIRELRAENERLRKENEELNNKAANLRMFLSRIASKFAWGTLDQDFVTEIMGHAQRIYPSSPLRFEGDPIGGCDK